MVDTRRRRVLAVLGGAATALAGCTGSSATETPTPTATQADPVVVGMGCYTDRDEYFFKPDLVQVPPGGTVEFGSTSACGQRSVAYHPSNDAPLRIPEGAEPWASPFLRDGGTFTVTFDTPGVYDYFGPHEAEGQVGSVVVGSPSPENQPGLAPPQSSLPEAAREAIRSLNDRTRELL